jgi:ABC-type bacteriocin/lantibiotic exporter with double-glycine peptidase domain
MEAADCGAACLAMVLGFHGRHVGLQEAREIVGFARGGVSAGELVEAGHRFGLRGRGFRLEPEELKHLPAGSVLHWGLDHFVVYEGKDRRGVWVVDPVSGRDRIPWPRFRELFTGVALTFEPEAGFETGGARASSFSPYLKRLLRRRSLLVQIVVLSLLVQLAALSLPLLLGLVVDRIVPSGDANLLLVIAGGMAVVVGFQVVSQLVRAFLLLQLRASLDVELSAGFVDRLANAPLRFFQVRPAGDLVARYESNRALRHTVTAATLSTLLDGGLVVLYLGLLFAASPRLGALVVFLGLLQMALLAIFGGRYRERMSAELEAEARTQSHLVEMLAGIETLKPMGAETRWVERWSNLFVREVNAGIRRTSLGSVAGAVTSGLTLASPLAIVLLGAWLVLEGRLTLGTMMALQALAVGVLTPLSSLITTALTVQEAKGHVARIADVLSARPEQDLTKVRPAPPLTGKIELEEVRFRYGEHEPWVLDGVSLAIQPGQKVAIVGRSGAGKSTLARLMTGLFVPQEGRVLLDGQELTALEARSVRAQIGVVVQDARVFGGTVRENVTLGDPAIDAERVVEAARLAEIHGDLEALPMGYETPVAGGGATLSGGQRQRIALARALARRPALLLLDEATSDLDTQTEARITSNLAGLRATRIVIAHRLSTVVDADLIVVLDRGRIVESGTHADLLSKGGVYAILVAAQTASHRG